MNDPMQVPPPPPTGPPVEGRPGNAWDRREQIGIGQAFVETVKEFATAPTDAFARTRETGDMVGPILFAVVIWAVVSVVSQLWQGMFGGSMLGMLPPEVRDQLGPYMASGTGCFGLVMGIVAAVIFSVVFLFIWIAILHLATLVVGGLKESRSGFEGTLRVACFASVAQLAGLVPFVGGLVGMVWSLILLVIGISTMHRTSTGTAVVAVLVPVVVCCVCIGAGIALTVGGIAAAVSGAGLD